MTQSLQDRYGIQPAKIISEERYWDMLEVMPPSKWQGINGYFESFHVCERLSGDIVSWFVRVGGKGSTGTYYELQDHDYLTQRDLKERIDAAMTEAAGHTQNA